MSKIRINCLYLPLLWILSLGLSACSDDGLVGPRPQWSDLVLNPEDGAILVDDFHVTIGTNVVDSMTIFLDGSMLAIVTVPPFAWPLCITDHEAGEHTLEVTVLANGIQSQLSARILMCHGVGTSVGNFAPLFHLEDLDGITYSPLPLFSDKVTLLDFWATWCSPCRLALPETQRLFNEYGDQGLKVLTINPERRDTVESFIYDNEYTFPVLLDIGWDVNALYNVSGIPMYFVIDHRGVVRFVRLGSSGTPLEDIIKPLLLDSIDVSGGGRW